MRSLHVVVGVHLTLYSGMLSRLQNWILRKLVFSYKSLRSPLKLTFPNGTLFEGFLGSLFICVHKDGLVDM